MSPAPDLGIQGYAALYGSSTVIGEDRAGYGFRETIVAGAFAGVLTDPRTYAAFNHDPSLILARLGAGNLRLLDDARGLRYEVDLPETTLGRDLGWMVARGMVTGSSFAFVVAPGGDEWSIGADGLDQRRVLRFQRLVDVAPVVSPAYDSTAEAGAALAPTTGRSMVATATDRRLAAALARYTDARLIDARVSAAMSGLGSAAPSASAPGSDQDRRLAAALAASTPGRATASAPLRSGRRMVAAGAVERRYLSATVATVAR